MSSDVIEKHNKVYLQVTNKEVICLYCIGVNINIVFIVTNRRKLLGDRGETEDRQL